MICFLRRTQKTYRFSYLFSLLSSLKKSSDYSELFCLLFLLSGYYYYRYCDHAYDHHSNTDDKSGISAVF